MLLIAIFNKMLYDYLYNNYTKGAVIYSGIRKTKNFCFCYNNSDIILYLDIII